MIADELGGNGAEVRYGAAVGSIDVDGRVAAVHTDRGPVTARTEIVCAGLRADRLARRAGAPGDPQIVPFRGAYLPLEATAPRINGMI